MTMSSPQNDKVESITLTNSNSSSQNDDGTVKLQQACAIMMESAMTSISDSDSGIVSVEDPAAIMDATAALVSHVSPDCTNDETIPSQTTAPDPSHHGEELPPREQEPTIATQLDPYFAMDNSTSHHHGEEEDDDDDDDLSDFGEVMGSASATNLLFSNNNLDEDDTFSFPPPPPPSMPPPPPPTTTTTLEEEKDATESSPNDTDDSDDEESWNRPPPQRPAAAAPRSGGAGHRLVDTFRKAGVAVAGGTLTAVGLVMIPLPTPMGCVVAGSGMALLGTEFEAANRVLASVQSSAEAARDRLIDNVEQTLLQDADTSTSKANKKDPKAPEIVIKDKLKQQQQQQQQQQSSGDDENLEQSSHNNSQQGKKTAEEDDDDDEDDTSAMVIQVRADAYFEPDDDATKHQRRFFRSASSTDSNAPGFLAGTRQKLRQDTRGFLATRVLPFLHKTKQFGSSAAAAPQPPK